MIQLDRVTSVWGKGLTMTDVTTPNVLPLPPRSAQKMSGLLEDEVVMKLPSAVTI